MWSAHDTSDFKMYSKTEKRLAEWLACRAGCRQDEALSEISELLRCFASKIPKSGDGSTQADNIPSQPSAAPLAVIGLSGDDAQKSLADLSPYKGSFHTKINNRHGHRRMFSFL